MTRCGVGLVCEVLPVGEGGLALFECLCFCVVVGDVVDESHVGVKGVHGGAFGLWEEF